MYRFHELIVSGSAIIESVWRGTVPMSTKVLNWGPSRWTLPWLLFFLVRDGRVWEGAVYFEVVVVARWARREPLSRE